jgi:hypothetical protein
MSEQLLGKGHGAMFPGMRTPRFVRRLMLGMGLLVGGVALGASNEPAIAVRLPQAAYNVRLVDGNVVANHIQLNWTPTKMQGRAFGTVAMLSLKQDQVSGHIGGVPVNLKARTEGGVLIGEGGFLRGPAQVRFSPQELHVYLNGCSYRLKLVGDRYEGPRSCDSLLAGPVTVGLPEDFQKLTPAEQVLLLLLSLG